MLLTVSRVDVAVEYKEEGGREKPLDLGGAGILCCLGRSCRKQRQNDACV